VFWSSIEKQTLDLLKIKSGDIDHIAIANPKIAPYGRAAIEALKFYHLYDEVESKLVYGESIAQVNQFIISGAAYGGFTAKATVMAPQISNVGTWLDLDVNSYSPIEQGVIVLANTRMLKEANEFEKFLTSPRGTSILKRYGYEIR
jgi:molybdate transport system substrate-binding protein